MKLDIHPLHFVEIQKKSYSLDHVYILKLIEQQFDVSDLVKESLKIQAIYNSLLRKGLITDEDKITTLGIELLTFLGKDENAKLPKKKTSSPEFEEWWKAFPGTDTFTHKGRLFQGGRALRAGKEDCKTKFNKILLEGEHTAQQLIAALKYDVLQKKEMSYIHKNNKLSYMQNSLTYLNQRSFEAYIELINEGIEIKEESTGSTDI
jgi:hypothetical protein